MASKHPQSKETENSEKEFTRPEDWQLGKKVLECNKHMFENAIECDVKFSFPPPDGPKRSKEAYMISAHKYVLISRSPVFYAMLSGPARDESGRISIEDINVESFREMLRSVSGLRG